MSARSRLKVPHANRRRGLNLDRISHSGCHSVTLWYAMSEKEGGEYANFIKTGKLPKVSHPKELNLEYNEGIFLTDAEGAALSILGLGLPPEKKDEMLLTTRLIKVKIPKEFQPLLRKEEKASIALSMVTGHDCTVYLYPHDIYLKDCKCLVLNKNVAEEIRRKMGESANEESSVSADEGSNPSSPNG